MNIFRKIRQKFLFKNGAKSNNYLKYAIGEILLVVIGILIALQVNNWNNDRQNQIKEKGILEELKSGLLKDKNLLEATLERYSRDFEILNELDSLLKIPSYEYKQDLNELFGKVYGIRFSRLNNAFYEDLKSSGLQIIKNKKIRSKIVVLFETNYKHLDGFLESERGVNQVIRPYYLANFTEIDFHSSANPINYQKIWTDPYYKNIVHYRIITLKSNHLKEYTKTIDSIDQIVILIDSYLNNK